MSEPSGGRRDFLKTALVAGFPAIIRAQTVTNALKVGLVGCGGRGSGAAAQALKADDYSELTAMADVAEEPIAASLDQIRKWAPKKVKEDPRRFVGLDSYKALIDSGIDVVLLAAPPGFRPAHFRYAVDAKKHIFTEKPLGSDVPGCRSILDASRDAKRLGLNVVSGFCWRYSNYIKETFRQIHEEKAIGDLVAYYATYYTSPVKPITTARPAGMGDVEWQIRNWYNFTWLSGDGLVEQAIHSVDKVAWAMRDQMPASCVAVGGRQRPAEGGNIFDHYEVNYVWPNGFRAFVAWRHFENCHNENSDYILGTKGRCTIGKGPLPRIEGQTTWTFEGEKNDMYQAEHDALFQAIRRGTPINDGEWMCSSTMMGLMGRLAAHTGKEVSWDQAWNSQEKLVPDNLKWDMSLPVAPTPIPGVTELK